MTTLLLAEHDNKVLRDTTAKALTAASQLGSDVHVLVAGQGCKAVAEAAAKLEGVGKVLLADAAPYAHMLAEPVASQAPMMRSSRRPPRWERTSFRAWPRYSTSCRFPT
jgi:electron transfer flavoprotein alpha subunit